MPNANGFVVWRGPSPVFGDNKPIVCCLVKSANRKTGESWQTWIIREDVYPAEALNNGEDVSVCGDCPHRKQVYNVDGKPVAARKCYVMPFSIGSVYKSYRKGNYPYLWDNVKKLESDLADTTKPLLRLGAYGDPAMLPYPVTQCLLDTFEAIAPTYRHVGYTHQWNQPWYDRGYDQLLMLSCDTFEEVVKARRRGARYFYAGNDPRVLAMSSLCPASKEYREKTGKLVTCQMCGLCNGSQNAYLSSIRINPHGPKGRPKFFNLPLYNKGESNAQR